MIFSDNRMKAKVNEEMANATNKVRGIRFVSSCFKPFQTNMFERQGKKMRERE